MILVVGGGIGAKKEGGTICRHDPTEACGFRR